MRMVHKGALVTLAAAGTSASDGVMTRIVTFRYSSIQSTVRRSLEHAGNQGAPQDNPNAAALARSQVPAFLHRTAADYASEKKAAYRAVPGVSVVRDFPLIPVAVVHVSGATALARLKADPRVASVTADQVYTAAGSQRAAGPAAGALFGSKPADLKLIDDPPAQKDGDTGDGTVVAVLDDGTDYTKSAFGNCRRGTLGSSDCSVLAASVFGTTPPSNLSWTGHGTNVAAQVLKDAPDAKLIVGNVFGSSGAATSSIMNGLNWVLSQQLADASTYSFRAVSMSLGSTFSYNTAVCADSPYTATFAQLLGVGIQPVVAAGNSAYEDGTFKPGIASPACTPGALAVGAVYSQNVGRMSFGDTVSGHSDRCADAHTGPDQVACFSQGGSLVGVLAPGVNEKAAGITESGTSQATPLVSGAIAALASGAPGASISQITGAIEGSGAPVTDARNGGVTPRLDVAAAEHRLDGEAAAGAIIASGHVGLGVTEWGDLNLPASRPSAGGTAVYGLRYLPTNNDFTGPGCLCEGWGVADAAAGTDGYADEDSGRSGLSLVSFTHTATTATSVVSVGSALRVTNAYRPATRSYLRFLTKPVPDLYEDKVTIRNTSGHKLDNVVYRRLVDWDMEPTAFDEYVTVQGFGNSKAITATGNDGFGTADPLSPPADLGSTGNFVHVGPSDQGAQFNFSFGALKRGASITFTEFYGAAPSLTQAYQDMSQVKVQAYSVGEPSSSSDGTPNTAILAFSGIGGKNLTFPPAG